MIFVANRKVLEMKGFRFVTWITLNENSIQMESLPFESNQSKTEIVNSMQAFKEKKHRNLSLAANWHTSVNEIYGQIIVLASFVEHSNEWKSRRVDGKKHVDRRLLASSTWWWGRWLAGVGRKERKTSQINDTIAYGIFHLKDGPTDRKKKTTEKFSSQFRWWVMVSAPNPQDKWSMYKSRLRLMNIKFI